MAAPSNLDLDLLTKLMEKAGLVEGVDVTVDVYQGAVVIRDASIDYVK